jgi:hypothetical protein
MSSFTPGVNTANLHLAAAATQWIWEGFLAPGQITLFTSMWKSGKTTLLAHLLAQRQKPGLLLERAVSPGLSAIVSEETASLWHARHVKLGLGDNWFYLRPFVATPSRSQWAEFTEHLASLKQSDGVDLVVIDPLSHFLPGQTENNATLLLEGLMPLRKLTDAGQAVLLLHHPRKAASAQGAASRGSGMLPAFVDVLIEMYLLSPDDASDRRRRLAAFSRHAVTPRSLIIELREDGSAYACTAPPPEEDDFEEAWQMVRTVLEDAKEELTCVEIIQQWPDSFPKPSPTTHWRWLNTALQRGLVQREGTGHRGDPFRYFLTEKLVAWKDDPMYQFFRHMRENAKKVAAAVG